MLNLKYVMKKIKIKRGIIIVHMTCSKTHRIGENSASIAFVKEYFLAYLCRLIKRVFDTGYKLVKNV